MKSRNAILIALWAAGAAGALRAQEPPGAAGAIRDRLSEQLLAQAKQNTAPDPFAEPAFEPETFGNSFDVEPEDSWMGWVRRNLIDRFNLAASLNIDLVGGFIDARDEVHNDVKRGYAREIEIALSADLTPTIRGDIFFALEREGDEFLYSVEEAYLTFLALPLGFQARAGKFKTAFGKSNLYHTHARPWIDVPLAQEIAFGEEGLVGTGISINRLVPNPWDLFSEITVEVFEIVKDSVAAEIDLRDRGQVAHWRTVFPVNDATTLELGLSGAYLSQRDGDHATAEGLDLTLKWQPPGEELYKSLTWQNEIYAVQTDTEGGRDNFFGAYTSIENQFTRRMHAGIRFDFSEIPGGEASNAWAAVPFVTFRQNERMFWRLQFNRKWNNPEDDGGGNNNELRVQFNYSLGKHRPHAY